MGMVSQPDEEVCPHCGSRELAKRVSRFRRGRGEAERLDEMADRLDRVGDPDSGVAMRQLAREMGHALDEDAADELEEMYEQDVTAHEAGNG